MFKRAIEPQVDCTSPPSTGLSPTVQARPSSGVVQQFAVAPKAKRIATFPFAKMEVDQHEVVVSNSSGHSSILDEYQVPSEAPPAVPEGDAFPLKETEHFVIN